MKQNTVLKPDKEILMTTLINGIHLINGIQLPT